MNGNYIEIEGKYYAIDVAKMIEFITEDGDSTQAINQTYGIPMVDGAAGEIKLVSKEVSETKDGVSENMSNIRYNIISNLLNLIVIPISDGNGGLILTDSLKNMHLGQVISFNTLYTMGIIYEIED